MAEVIGGVWVGLFRAKGMPNNSIVEMLDVSGRGLNGEPRCPGLKVYPGLGVNPTLEAVHGRYNNNPRRRGDLQLLKRHWVEG
ncbi:hypothetical protein KEJ49_01390 [Candidatus Bathyarchaeota archaeon]|nr:hypothetical protein [Candidatus Bathyarchaeota archaeon]